MKIYFQKKEGKLLASNYQTLKEYIIGEKEFDFATKLLGGSMKEHLWSALKKQTVYISLPKDKKNNRDFITIKALVIRRTTGQIDVWSNQYLIIEDKDVLYTTLEEAKKATTTANDINAVKDLQLFSQAMVDACGDVLKDLQKDL